MITLHMLALTVRAWRELLALGPVSERWLANQRRQA
jgi:hypothetical protein